MARRLRNTSLEADTICKRLDMDIVGISETGHVRKWSPHFREYTYLGHPDPDNPHHSVEFLIRPGIRKSITDITDTVPVNTCNMWLKASTGRGDKNPAMMGVYYIPVGVGNKIKRKNVFASIKRNVKFLRKEYGEDCSIGMCGDFNCYIGCCHTDTGHTFGNRNFDEDMDDGGRELRALYTELDLCILNGRRSNEDNNTE